MIRQSSLMVSIVVVMVLVASAVGYSSAKADDANAWTTATTNLRSGPGRAFGVVETLDPSTPLVVEGRNTDSSWLLVHVQTGTGRGWAATFYLKLALGFRVRNVQISQEEVAGAAPVSAADSTTAASIKPSADGTGADDSVIPAYTLPVPPLPRGIPTGAINAPVMPEITPRIRSLMRAVLYKGKQMGNDPHVFSLVGDCHTDHAAFFRQFGTGKYDLGQYGNLQEVISYFSVQAGSEGPNSFIASQQAAHSAFNAAAVLDWQTSDPAVCKANESPLRCEYRLKKPGLAIIMFGVVDVEVMTAEQFNLYMRYIVKDTLDRGIIPVLSTEGENTSNPVKARQFNQITVALAHEKSLPLINLEAALEGLPNHGMDPDGIHLTRPANVELTGFLNADTLKYGYTMRNLITLQALDVIIHQLLS